MFSPRLLSTRLCRHFSTHSQAVRDTSAAHLHSPAVYVMLKNESIDPSSINGTGKGGRISKGDIILAMKAGTAKKLEKSHDNKASTHQSTNQSTNQSCPLSRSRFTASGRRTRVSLSSILQQMNNEPQSTTVTKPSTTSTDQSTYQRRVRRGWAMTSSSSA